MLDSFTQFYFSHLDGILNVLTLVLILLFLILFVVIFLNSKNKKYAEGHNDDLEKTLRKVLESAELKATPMPMPTGNTDVSKEASQEVENLKKTVGDKAAEIEALKKQISEKQASGAGEDTSGLQLRLKELEAKLAEYEIIEDDIANLSMYKEENKRLRGELDKMQAGGTPEPQAAPPVVAAAPAPEPQPEPVPEPVAAVVEEVKETPVVPEPPPAVVAEAAAPTPAPAPAASSDEDDIMSEFVLAVAEQGASAPAPTQAVTPPPAAAVTPTPPSPAPVAEVKAEEPIETDDIMAEFEAAAQKAEQATKPATDTSITDDIMAEFEAAVQEKEKQKPSDEVKASASPLDENTDTDKILSEMDSLLSADANAPADDNKDPTEKLINEFESLTNNKT